MNRLPGWIHTGDIISLVCCSVLIFFFQCYSRRSTWELLQKKKKGRVIILTTHFLEEAEILGDRIIIMSDGKLRCAGSTLFLKSRFGAGYVLTITREGETSSSPSSSTETSLALRRCGGTGAGGDVGAGAGAGEATSGVVSKVNSEAALLRLVQTHVPSAKVYSSIGAELLLELPVDASPHFPALFATLKQYAQAASMATATSGSSADSIIGSNNKEEGPVVKATSSPPPSSSFSDLDSAAIANARLQISSYGVQYVTLEQVFIRLAEAEKHAGGRQREGEASPVATASARVEEGTGTATGTATGEGVELTLSRSPMIPSSLQSSFRGDVAAGAGAGGGGGKYDVLKGKEDIHMGALLGGDKEEEDEAQQKQQKAMQMLRLGGGGSETDSDTSSPRKLSQVVPVYDQSKATSCKESNTSNDFLPDDDEPPSNLIFVQLYELFRKRLIIARRDKKGMFFQICIPAIQIALVLAVLTISVNPAGKSLAMRADIYDETVTAILSENSTIPQADDFREYLTRMDFSHTTTNTSDELSEYMLETYNTPEGDRFGGYVFEDLINVNVTVEWLWVQDNLGLLLNNSDLLLPLLEGFNLTNININDGNSTFLTGLNISSTSPVVDDALDAIFGNDTSVVFNNITIYRSNITDIIDGSDEFVIGDGGDVTYDSIKIVNGDIVLVGVEIVLNNNTIDLGNVTIDQETLALLLPNETITYNTQVATDYSVLQNSTSPHAVGVFISELVTAAFVNCRGGDASTFYSLRNHPLPLTIEQAIEIQVILSVLASLFIIIPLSYIPANFVIFIVKERTSKSERMT